MGILSVHLSPHTKFPHISLLLQMALRFSFFVTRLWAVVLRFALLWMSTLGFFITWPSSSLVSCLGPC